MKLVFGCLLLLSSNVYSIDLTDKNPSIRDISINILIEKTCYNAGFFNPLACNESVSRCYYKQNWPKTVNVGYKIDVVNYCLNKYIRH